MITTLLLRFGLKNIEIVWFGLKNIEIVRFGLTHRNRLVWPYTL